MQCSNHIFFYSADTSHLPSIGYLMDFNQYEIHFKVVQEENETLVR